MQELVEFVVKQLVDDKDNVQISAQSQGKATTITVKVAPNEMGKVIGKRGKIITAIRCLAKAVGNKDGIKYTIEVVD